MEGQNQGPNMDQFEAYFRRAALDGDGRISGAEAVAFFQGSNLRKQVLVQVSAPGASLHGASGTSVGNSTSNNTQRPWPKMKPSDVQKYTKVFMEVDIERDGKITGERARNLFLSWRIPREVLKQVWDLSDQDNDGMLSLREFCFALYLMERYREGHPPPATLPPNVMFDETLLSMTDQPKVPYGNAAWGPRPGNVFGSGPSHPVSRTPTSSVVTNVAGGPQTLAKQSSLDSLQSAFPMQPAVAQLQTQLLLNPSQQVSAPGTSLHGTSGTSVGNSTSNNTQRPWPKMKPSDVQKYTKVFMEVDIERDGKITGKRAQNLFLSWRIPREVLKQIWDLSDQDNDGMLSLREFCFALYLMERYREGHPLPAALPPNVMFDETLPSMKGQPKVPYGNAAWGPRPDNASEALVVSGNGFGSGPSDPVSRTPTSSVVTNVAGGPQLLAKQGSLDSLQSAFSTQPAGAQLQTQLSLNPSQQVSAPGASLRGTSGTSVGNSTSDSMLCPWPKMKPSDVQKYTKVFMEVDIERDGKITGEQARNLFLSWRLPREVLKQVWDLSDQDNDGMLSLREFCFALYLMERYREGHPLSAALSPNVIFDETLLSMTDQPKVPYGNAAWGPRPVFGQHLGMPGARPVAHASGLRPPMPVTAPQADGWGTTFGNSNVVDASSIGWMDNPSKEDYNGWGMPDSGSSQHLQTNGDASSVLPTNNGDSTSASSASVPSAPPTPEEAVEEGPICYPSIDLSSVEWSVPPAENAASDMKDEGSSSCVICWEAPIEGACIPCGHMAGCMTCLNEIKAKNGACPICRAKINQVIRLYAV